MNTQNRTMEERLISESNAREGIESERDKLFLYDIIRSEIDGAYKLKLVKEDAWWDGMVINLKAGGSPKALHSNGTMRPVSSYSECEILAFKR